MARVRKLTPFTQTRRGNDDGRSVASLYVKNWDARIGPAQAMARSAVRYAQGQKRTPIGAGTLRRK